MASKAIVGEKVGMTQLWDDQNRVVAVTVVRVAPVRVLRTKTEDLDGYSALQVTFGFKRKASLNKPDLGQFQKAGVEPGKAILELRIDSIDGFAPGSEIDASAFSPGEIVDVTAISRGHGFSGGMKRHNFKGQGASHGNHKHHRAPGSIGACATPSRVFKGTRMAGQYGNVKVTTQNLEVIQADPERQLVLIKGSIPGPKGGTVVIRNAAKGAK
ncbi:MAG: 50S ribosomal protein L3 [Acidimicrobiaceae bacterium]|nr:50S ribosomal protein L3 [Acidimicrobiaceae bacterium]